MLSYARTNSSYFGFIYFGHGLKNKDLDFMLSN